MALWGTLRQRMGGQAPADSDAFVNDFFKKTKEDPRWELPRHESEMQAFVTQQLAEKRRGIALVTSGATIVPLDAETGSFVDLSSQMQEYQGPACAEFLLQQGYAVIFLHREDSLQPFTRHFQKYIQDGAFMSMFHVRKDQLVLEGMDLTQQLRMYDVVALYNDSKDRLLNVSFTSVQQYLLLLRIATKSVSPAKTCGVVILAATVMEFYVPQQEQSTASGSGKRKKGEFSVSFVRVPDVIRKIRKEWCPSAFVVTFKHNLKADEMIEAAHADLEKYGVDVVAGTNRCEEPLQIIMVTEQEETILSCPEDEDINDAFASSIAQMHRHFRRTREILEKGKQLLLLSAKFSMLKETDLVNEDAEGNKNVKFGKGVKICTDRRSGDKSPIYELKHIFQNKSHCARAHIWTSTIEHKSGQSGLDVVVAFSPAGNPETIRDVWGDFWSGWAEDEIKEFKQEMSQVSLTSALNVVTSSISGDYTPASQLLQYMWSKFGSAWSDGEQTRVRQSIQNMITVGLDRGLVEPDGISPLEKLMHRPRVRRFESLVLDQAPILQSHPSRRRRRDSDEESESNPVRVNKARTVRVHRALNAYMKDMIDGGLLDAIMEYVEQGAAVHITGYSMGGMLGQLIMLYLGDRARMKRVDSSKINFVGFGTPRVGDAGFAARLRMLFDPEQLIIVMHPSDSVHAFPPSAEGYTDAALKIFLRQDGLGVGRRTASTFSLLPVARSMDRIFERAFIASSVPVESACSFCSSKGHSTAQHRCRYCIERGSHRGADCPNRKGGCRLCGHSNHSTGEHRCRVCQQYGHRGRECHAQRDVGLTEIVAYFRFHHFLYYNSNLKKTVEAA